ncbi:MAG: hypothetical protein P1U37_06315 [Minwuia sp.]|nr:hypothetical protein [Minwuia sp.]
MISGRTKLIAHLGRPIGSFMAPMIYNPYFGKHDIDAVVMPMGCQEADYATFLPQVARLSNFLGALVTMPYKTRTVDLLDEVTTTVSIAGACNAVRRDADGRLIGDMFDGEGFVRGLRRKGRTLSGARVLVIGSGGVGSAIAASLARSGVATIGLRDINHPIMDRLAARLTGAYPELAVQTDAPADAGWDVIVNATPLGMNANDPMPMDAAGIAPSTLVGEVVMARKITPFLAAAQARGCEIQVGVDMLFEQIPAYLEFFGLRSTTPEELRAVARIGYKFDSAG